MSTYYDSQNKPYVLSEQIGRGGEGAVFSCENDLELVAKIYHEPITKEKEEKLRWMAAHKNEHLLKVAAWVIDVLRDAPDGKVVGFLMPNVRAKEIHELYSLKSRRVHFPEATWHFLVHTAANLARGFYSLHRDGHVMGDINHGNCVVLADGTVKLIDCDSYSISTENFRYRCEVGVATHLAPELQGANLSEIERENKHDNFGLAVIIFQLLFLGRHPFSGNFLGAEDKSLEDCIREYRFAYGDNTDVTKVKQPPGTLSLSEVSPRIAAMFERAFLIDDRPEPREWVEALDDLSKNLEQCSLHPGHLYYEKLAVCPWCKIEAQTGLMLFPFITSRDDPNGEKSFNIFTIENLIANLGITPNLPAKPPQISILPPPSLGIAESRSGARNLQIGIIAAQFLIVSVLMLAFGVGIGCFFGIILMIFFVVVLNNPGKELRSDLNETLFAARQQWEKIEGDWSKVIVPQKVNDDLAQIRNRIDGYQQFQQSIVRQTERLRENIFRDQLDEHLRDFQVADSQIPLMQINALEIRDVRTAKDISKERLEPLLSVDDETKDTLLRWRAELEGKFVPPSENERFEAEQKQLLQENAGKRRRIEREIEGLFASLRSASVYLRQHQQNLVAQSETISRQLVQAESDLNALGNSSAAILVLLLVTFLTPFWGGVFSQLMSPNVSVMSSSTKSYDDDDSPPPPAATTSGGVSKSTALMDTSAYSREVPKDSITDEEIAQLSDFKRAQYANNLSEQAKLDVSYEYEDGERSNNYAAAAYKLRLAVRLKNDDTNLLNQLGYALYKQEKYDESLEQLKASLKINDKNTRTKNYIGINYLEMKRYENARKIFTQLTENDWNSNENFFNLGLAYEGLKNYGKAAEALRQAVRLKPDDADSRYELGYCLYKLDDKNGAYEQYVTLTDKNRGLAQKLYEAANLKDYKLGKTFVLSDGSPPVKTVSAKKAIGSIKD